MAWNAGRRRSLKAAAAGAVLALGALPSAGAAARAGGAYTRNVAIVLYQGVELLDFAGPGEVFASAGGFGARGSERAFNVYTVATSAEPVLSQGFVRVTPAYSIDDAPRPDLIVIPGGNGAPLLDDARVMAWIRKSAGEAELTLTVCTGAFALGRQGLLDGRDVTTFYGALDNLRAEVPRANVQAGRRFIDSGNVVTTAGVSAGIDGALHVVARLLGRAVADQTARYMEYHWTPESYLARDYKLFNPSLDDAGRAAQQIALRYEEKDYAGAAEAGQALVARDPSNGQAWYELGRALHSLERYDAAAEANRRAAESTLWRPRALFNLACARARLGQKDAALEALDGAISAGFKVRWLVAEDPDLAGLRNDPRYLRLLARL